VGIAKNSANESGLMLPIYELRGFIWAGLLDESPDITVKQVGDLLDEHLMKRPAEIGKSLIDALMESSFFKAAEKKEPGPKPTVPRTGRKRITSKSTTSSPLE